MDNTSFAPGNNSINNSVPPPTPQYSAPEQKHFLNKKFAVTMVILLVVAGGAYGAMQWYGSQQVAQEVAPTFTPRPSASASPDVTTGWQTYTNTQYGFSLTLTDTWKGYKVDLETMSSNFGAGTLAFKVPTTDKTWEAGSGYAAPFKISIYQPEYWAQLQKDGGPIGKFLGKSSDGWVFVVSFWQDVPADLMNVNLGVDQIISTFKLTK